MPTTIEPISRQKAARREVEKVAPFVPGEAEATELNNDHQALQDDFASLTDRQARLGEKLEKIKKALGRVHYGQWVDKHLTFCARTARRYMAQARAKRTALSASIARAITGDEPSLRGGAPEKTPTRRPVLKLFSAAADKVLNQPPEKMEIDDKLTILRDFERLEPIAMQLLDRPSVFSLTWQKKLQELPVRWARKDIVLLKAEIDKAQAVLAALDDDAQFDTYASANSSTQPAAVASNEGDAP